MLDLLGLQSKGNPRKKIENYGKRRDEEFIKCLLPFLVCKFNKIWMLFCKSIARVAALTACFYLN